MVTLRAWTPAPAVSIVREGAQAVTIRLLKVPARVRLRDTVDVTEATAGPERLISIGGTGRRDLQYLAPSDGVTFAALGDTGSSETFAQALVMA